MSSTNPFFGLQNILQSTLSSPNTFAIVLIVISLTLMYVEHSKTSQGKKKKKKKKQQQAKSISQKQPSSSTGGPLKNIFSALRRQKNVSTTKENNNASSDKPFGSSYYYAHNNPEATGGYKDGLKMEDYVMNKPRLLSKGGVPVMDDYEDDDVDGDNNNEKETVQNEEYEKESTAKISSTPIIRSSSFTSSSLPIRKFGWEDTSDSIRIRIDTLPTSTSSSISWEEAGIPKHAIETKLINKNLGFLLQIQNPSSKQTYHLSLPNLYEEAKSVSILWKRKKLIVKIEKKKKGRTWSSLTSASVATVDEKDWYSVDWKEKFKEKVGSSGEGWSIED